MSTALEAATAVLHAAQASPTTLQRHHISQSTRRLKMLQQGADAVSIALAFGVTYLYLSSQAGGGFDPGYRRLPLCVLSLPMWLVVFSRYRLYTARNVASRVEACSRLLRAIAMSVGIMAVFTWLIGLQASRSLLLGGAVLSYPLCLAEREGMRAYFRRLRNSGRLSRRAVIIGSNEEALDIARMFLDTRHLGYDVVGLCGDLPSEDGADTRVPWLGSLSAVSEVIATAGVSTAVIATTALGPAEVNWVVRRLHDAGIHIELSAGLRDIPAERLSVRDLGRHAVFYLEPTVHHGWRAAAKRAFDLSVSIPTLLLASPVLLACAVAIRLTSDGPAFFHQERVGKDGLPFQIHKLRTMVKDADAMLGTLSDQNEADGPLFKVRNDPRVTRMGRMLRKLSVDELPQLWNVIRSEMSLVGPRPALPRELSGWSVELHNRLRVKPGVTGMWQVSGRSTATFDDYVRYDLFYVDNWTLMRDLAIFAKTLPAVVLRRGAC